jgi:hypothetical protein
MSGRTGCAAGKLLLHEFVEADAVAAEPHRLIELVGPGLEAAQPLEDVIGPAGFAVFAVIDDVDAGLGLTRNDVCDLRFEFLLIVGPDGLDRRFRTDEAAHVGCQDTIFAALHCFAC